MIGHTYANGVALGIEQTFWHFPARFENECIAARRGRLERPVLYVVDDRVLPELREVAADQREMMMRIQLADATHALHGALVADLAAQRIAGIGRIYHQSAVAHDFDRATNESLLGIFGMYRE